MCPNKPFQFILHQFIIALIRHLLLTCGHSLACSACRTREISHCVPHLAGCVQYACLISTRRVRAAAAVDESASGEQGIDWRPIGAPTAAVPFRLCKIPLMEYSITCRLIECTSRGRHSTIWARRQCDHYLLVAGNARSAVGHTFALLSPSLQHQTPGQVSDGCATSATNGQN